MSNIVQSPQAMRKYLEACKRDDCSEATVKIPTGQYKQKKYRIEILGVTLSRTVEEETYVTMTFKFK